MDLHFPIRLIQKMPTPPIRGFKITTMDRKRKVGIAASSLSSLKTKAARKLAIPDCRVYLASDGTEIEDEEYFATIADQSLLVVAAEEDDIKTDFQILLEIFQQKNDLLGVTVGTQDFICNNREYINRCLNDWLPKSGKDRIDLGSKSHKADDPDWFQGTDSKFSTKEEAMYRRAQDRIRGYFYKVKDELIKTELYQRNSSGRKHIEEVLNLFRMFLQGCNYFGCLFDRSRCSSDQMDSGEPLNKKTKLAINEIFLQDHPFEDLCCSLCDESGEFKCQGKWNAHDCEYDGRHFINPYSNRENLIVFQTWNLDHQIELGRSVIPGIIAAIKELMHDAGMCSKHKTTLKSVDVVRFFKESFTVSNLKLVHIACHIKEAHGLVELEKKPSLVCKNCPNYEMVMNMQKEIKARMK